MRTRTTGLVVTGVLILVLVATVDALRGAEGDHVQRRPSTGRTPALVNTEPDTRDLEREGVSGTIYLTVRTGPGCEFRVYALPLLRLTGGWTSSPADIATCRFQVSPDGRRIAELHECPASGGIIRDVLDPSMGHIFPGCGGAWKPDGTFTYIARGGVVEAESVDCLGTVGCVRTVVPRRALAQGAARLRRVALGADARRFRTRLTSRSISQVEWLTTSRVAVVYRVRQGESMIFFQGRRVVRVLGFPFAPHPHLDLVPGRRQILVGGRVNGFTAFTYDGRFADPNPVPFFDGAAVAESPDGRWLALARPGNVCIYRRRDESQLGCIAADAQDLAWR